MRRGRDVADLMPVAAALGNLHERELCALIDLCITVPRIVPGLLAWIGHACDWELNRRAYIDFPLLSPGAVIAPDEATASVAVAMALRARFGQDESNGAGGVVDLFDAIIQTLGTNERRH